MKNWISTTISIVSLSIAIVALAKTAPIKDLDFDYYGAIIGVLSFLVTLLMGYQIYTVINVKKEMDEVRKAREEMDRRLEKKAAELTQAFREELNNVAPLIMAISRPQSDIIEKTAFATYKDSKVGELSRDLSSQTILMLLDIYAGIQDGDKRSKKIAELAKNVKYDDVVEFYTDYAKSKDNKRDDIEQVLLELIGILTEKEEG